ncbi:MAG: hypothetical protein ABEJ70_02770 [Halobacteriaceae archaeon]
MADSSRSGPHNAWRVAAALVVAGALAATGVGTIAGPATAVSFSATDVSVTSQNGKLQDLTVAPTGTVRYSGLEAVPPRATVRTQVRVGGAWQTVATSRRPVSGHAGSVSFDFAPVSLFSGTGLSASSFAANSPQNPTTTTVTVRVHVTFPGAGPNGADVTVTGRDDFAVTVSKQAGNSNGGGNGTSKFCQKHPTHKKCQA